MMRPLPNLLVDCRRQMISPIAVQTAFDLEFERFTAESFANLHLSYFELVACSLLSPTTVLLWTPASSTTNLARRRISSGIRHCCLRPFIAVVFTTKQIGITFVMGT